MKKDRPRVGQGAPEAKEPYEVLLEEMRARRRRLNELLRLVRLEEKRRRDEAGGSPRARCRSASRQFA